MSESVPSVPSPKPRRRLSRPLAVAAAVLILLIAVLAGVWLNRRAVARDALVGWLDRKGIEADVEIERIELDGVTARIRVGDPKKPDFTVERAEVDYVIGWPWSGGLGVTPSRIRLVRPLLRASWRGGELSLGSLDPLVKEFTARPPRPDAKGPLVIVEGGRVALTTEYGPVQVRADARIDNGKLMSLDARMPAASLKSGEVEAHGLTAALRATTTGDRLAFSLGASADRFETPSAGGRTARLTLSGEVAYPDTKTRRGDGAARIEAVLTGDTLRLATASATNATARLNFDGKTTGWLDAFRIEGQADAGLRAGGLTGPMKATGLSVAVDNGDAVFARDAQGFTWRLDGPARVNAASFDAGAVAGRGASLTSSRLSLGGRGAAFEASGPLILTADRLSSGELSLGGARGAVDLDLVQDGRLRIEADGSLNAAHGAWPLFGAPAGDDIPELGAMKRALGDFSFSAPAFRFALGPNGSQADLLRPVRIAPANGGAMTITQGRGPVFLATGGRPGGGALTVTATRGEGLPEATVSVPRWSLTPGGFTATLDGRAALDFGLARGVTVATRGELASSNGRLTYAAGDCAAVSVERLELDENDITAISGGFCPSGGPLVTVADGAWRAGGAIRGVSASAPFLALDFSEAAGRLDAFGGPGGLGLDARIDTARVEDATTPDRFNPAMVKGAARLRGESWSGAFDILAGERRIGGLTLAHNGELGAGGIVISSEDLVFAEGGLQPADLSPLLEGVVGSPATGSARFDGRVDWTADGAGSSSGVLSIPGLDFVSPAGPVKGLKGQIVFTSLTPLVTAPGQSLTADLLETIVPLTGVEIDFAVDKAALTVAGAQLSVGGGTLSIEPFSVPLDPDQPVSGVIVLDRVQLGELIAGSGFGDKVNLDAVVSGRVPFIWQRGVGIRVADGRLAAVQPGRLSIAREALSGLEAGGGGDGVPPNTVQDLAYQAMENLAFDLLDAEVNSLDEGRLGVLFHIRGRHDPPEHQELRLSVSEFISREFLNRALPLPSDTGIDLTLDTTLNIEQLVSDIIAVNRARNGQPAAATE
ncbi:MAG: YdbH domain-containing protein [Pseudomonadota bacterium]